MKDRKDSKLEQITLLKHELIQNNAQLNSLSEKASQMFEHIKDIQKLINEKNSMLDGAMAEAELSFANELQKAIVESRKLKKQLQN